MTYIFAALMLVVAGSMGLTLWFFDRKKTKIVEMVEETLQRWSRQAAQSTDIRELADLHDRIVDLANECLPYLHKDLRDAVLRTLTMIETKILYLEKDPRIKWTDNQLSHDN